ncbi:MAG: hypothetical protein P8O10_02570 [Pseudorhodobacter sp.]|nr:hypothetical protein [Pseudorhodobacter sp.]
MSLPGLAEALAAQARAGRTISYGDLARQLAIPGPGAIAKLTAALEALMAEDAAANQPLRAALCHSRLGNGQPAPGFFDMARHLGRFDGTDPAGFVAAERASLFKAAATA